jgi:acyl carrier protein
MRRPLNSVGVDSLMATEVSLALIKEYGVRFAVLDILRKLSVADIAGQVLAKAAPEEALA